jgi:hypothetical protein
MQLNGIKASHFHIVETIVAIDIDAGEPVSDTDIIGLVFFTQHEIDKIFVRKIVSIECRTGLSIAVQRYGTFKGPRRSIKDTIDDHVGERMIAIFQQVLSSDSIVPVMIELPEATIQDIKVFVGEIASDFVNVIFLVNEHKSLQQIASAHLTTRNPSRMTLVDTIEDARNDRDSILFLKFRMIAQEFQSL